MSVSSIYTGAPGGIQGFGSSLKPSLSEYIWQLSPEKFPLLELFEHEPEDQVEAGWQADILGDPDITSQPEGFDYSTKEMMEPIWLKSNTQINWRGYGATKTRQKAAHYGKKNLMNYEGTKKSKELKTDMEKAIVENTERRLTNTSQAGMTPGLLYWMKDTSGAGKSATEDFKLGTRNSGKFSVNIVDAQGDYFNEILLNQAIQLNFDANINPGIILGSGKNIGLMQDFTGGIVKTQDSKYKNLQNITKVYTSFFGDVEVMPIRAMAGKQWVAIIDPELWKIGIFRNFEKVDVNPNTASRLEKGIEIEWMLKCMNPHGNTLIDNLHA